MDVVQSGGFPGKKWQQKNAKVKGSWKLEDLDCKIIWDFKPDD